MRQVNSSKFKWQPCFFLFCMYRVWDSSWQLKETLLLHSELKIKYTCWQNGTKWIKSNEFLLVSSYVKSNEYNRQDHLSFLLHSPAFRHRIHINIFSYSACTDRHVYCLLSLHAGYSFLQQGQLSCDGRRSTNSLPSH